VEPAVDVMKNVPSVNVDIDGNVTLRNNAPQIFVDGRPTNMTLEQIPADAIETVEVITNPSAKFDASGGTAGILNITLKKNKRVGYSGNVRASVDSRARVGGGGDFNLRQNKINFFASGMLHQRKSISEGFTDRINFGRSDTINRFFQDDMSIAKGQFGFGRGGFDYFLDNRNTITVNGNFQRGRMRPNMESDIDLVIRSQNFIESAIQRRTSNSDFNFRNNGGQLSFKHLFPKAGHEMTADVTVGRGRNSSDNTMRMDFYNQSGSAINRTYTQAQKGSGSNDFMVIQTDYVNPLSDKTKIEMGARASRRTINSSNQFFTRTTSGSLIPTAPVVLYNSTDNVYAAYATFTNRINKFGYQLGLRAESSDYFGELPNKNQSFNIEFPVSFFPSVFLTQRFTDAEELQLNYSRKINRPHFMQLFPFIDSSDIVNVSVGNPGLRPEFTNSLELSYSKTFKNKDNLIASVYYKNTTDLITRFQGLDTRLVNQDW
jgi:outer membrane receptor protein involved in Fe transport